MRLLRTTFKWIGKHRIVSSLLFAAILAGTGYVRFASSRLMGVVTEPIQQGHIVESVYGIGTVVANRIFRITPGVTYTITDIFVKEGDFVKKGQKLIGTDTTEYRAPFSGTVTSLPFKIGDNVFPQIPILSLVDLSDRYLVVSLEQQGALRVRHGQKAVLSFDSIREQHFDGVVQAVYSNDNNFLARIDIGYLPAPILPGMTADVAIEIQERDHVLLVPVAALDKGKSVWVKEGRGLPKKIDVTVGIVDQSVAEITSGSIKAGDRLLIREKRP